jgi:hypothetical protein
MTVRLPPLRIAQAHRSVSFQCGPNDSAIVALLPVCPDGSDGKLGSRLAYARAGAANCFCGRTCQCPRTMGPRPIHGRVEANWNPFGIAMNQMWFDAARPPTPANRATEMVPKRSTTISGSNRRWRESRCSDTWCRGRMGERSASSLNGQIPSTIPTSTSDGVSKCSLTLGSGVSGSRMAAAALRPHPNIGCSRITSRSSATVAPRSTRPTVNVSAGPTIPGRPCKLEQTDEVLTEGGRGFNSLEGSLPVTAHTLIQRFFLVMGGLNYFLGFKDFKRLLGRFLSAKQRGLAMKASAFEYLFSRPIALTFASEKLSRNSRGGGS